MNNRVKYFYFVNKSCNRRQEEIQMVKHFLQVNDYSESEELKEADVIFLFTCAFCQSRVKDMQGELEKIKGLKKNDAEIIVGSCLPKTDPESLKRMFNGKTISPTDFSQLNNISGVNVKVDTFLPLYGKDAVCIKSRANAGYIIKGGIKKFVYTLLSQGTFVTAKKIIARIKFRFMDARKAVFISAGCVRKCSYCAIKFATGNLRSKPLDVVMKQIERYLKTGYKKIDLYADSIGDYGLDLGNNLGDLFDSLAQIKKRFSIGLYDLHPSSFIKYYDSIITLCKTGKVHYLYVPLQSGNERVLRLMNRPCKIDDLGVKLLQVRKTGNVFMQTSIITGFPGETSAEFLDTVDLLKKIAFDDVYVHFYSDMPNTESSKLPGKISKEIMKERLDIILKSGIKHSVEGTVHEWENISNI